jgi:hypothetical protein
MLVQKCKGEHKRKGGRFMMRLYLNFWSWWQFQKTSYGTYTAGSYTNVTCIPFQFPTIADNRMVDAEHVKTLVTLKLLDLRSWNDIISLEYATFIRQFFVECIITWLTCKSSLFQGLMVTTRGMKNQEPARLWPVELIVPGIRINSTINSPQTRCCPASFSL